jgi:uncharacterized membrane protein
VRPPTSRPLAALLTIGGALGLIAAFQLTVDKFTLQQNTIDGKQTSLGCDFSAFISCGDVMQSDQGEAFGFPNSILGLIGFSIVVTLGVLLWSRVELPGWVRAGLQLGVLFGIGFVTWLQYQSIYQLDRLCPWCLVVWVVMIPIFVLVTVWNLRDWRPDNPVARFLGDWTVLIVLLWYVGVASAVWFHFGDRLWA